MNALKRVIFFVILVSIVISCRKDDSKIEPPRPFAEQYPVDLAAIEEFLETHYMEVVNNLGGIDHLDVKFLKIEEGGTQTPIMQHPNLTTRIIDLHDLQYKIYYIPLHPGADGNPKPTNVDAVFTAYRGTLLDGRVVDYVQTPSIMLRLDNLIRGWREIFPQFRTGNYSDNGDGTITFEDFGAGVMFLPSGLGYYNAPQPTVPPYSPLVFSFKLYELERIDHDNDGIPSYLEDINGDGYLTEADDTDGDGRPDYLDVDDDGDGVMTRNEIKDADGNIIPFDLIPDCSGDTSNPNRLRKHRDPSCQ
ncbi:MAG: FKBP-type peptidyl-prolyl cis-trans isomerase [Flavobacterium sp.]